MHNYKVLDSVYFSGNDLATITIEMNKKLENGDFLIIITPSGDNIKYKANHYTVTSIACLWHGNVSAYSDIKAVTQHPEYSGTSLFTSFNGEYDRNTPSVTFKTNNANVIFNNSTYYVMTIYKLNEFMGQIG